MPDERPSFFELLGLDPDALWDVNLFRRRLAALQDEWGRKQEGFGAAAADAKRKLAFLKGVNAVMESDGGRQRERQKAKQSRIDASTRRAKELTERIRLTTAKGHLLRPEYDAFWTDYGDVLKADPGLRGRLEQVPVREEPARQQPPTGLGPTLEEVLRANLRTLRAPTLYDVLREVDVKINKNSPPELLLQAAEQLADKAHQTMDKSDPKVTAWERLAGLAKTFFRTAEERARYELFVQQEAVLDVLQRFETFLRPAARISPEQVEIYFIEVRELGVSDLDMARDRLVVHFQAKNWSVDLPGRETQARVATQVQCPYCAALNAPGSRACATCAFVLDQPCPSCGRVDPRYGGCGCGFPIGHRERVSAYVAEARHAVEEHDFPQAELLLARAEAIWRLPENTADGLAIEMRRLRARLGELRHDLDALTRRIDELLRTRRFVAAERQLRGAPYGLPRRELLLAEAEKAVREARDRCRTARRPGLTPERRSELYAEALRICDDLETARTELAAIPPAPPTNVRARIDDPAAGVLITWDASPAPDIAYVVMRGTGRAAPTSAEALPSQQRLGPVPATSLRDRDAAAMAGMALHYAVLADRLGTYSEVAKAEPIVMTTEATVSATSAGAGEIRLTWQTPERAAGVHITRTQIGVADSPRLMKPTEPGLLRDTDVYDGARYRYTVQVLYENPAGGFRYSRGASNEATATRPPAPPGRVEAVAAASEFGMTLHRVQLRWPDVGAGKVWVVRQDGVGTLRDGDRLTEAEVRRAGRVLDGSSPVYDHWIDRTMTVCTYTPVLILNGFGYVGLSRHYANATAVIEPAMEFGGPTVRLTWDWPEGCAGAVIGFDPAAPPADPTVAAEQKTVYRNPGEPGEYSHPLGPHFRTYVRIGTLVRRDNGEFVSTGVPLLIERPRLTVHYDVRDSRRRRELVLEVTESMQAPGLVLRGRAGGPPRSRRDGTAVLELSPMHLAGHRTFELPRQPGAADMHYRLFTASPADGARVSLEHR